MNRFAICQAFQQLESDYNVDGMLRERPSNQRRNESIGVQLHRMGYSSPYEWVEIEEPRLEGDDPNDDEVRDVYMRHALKWNLPLDEGLRAAIRRFYTSDFLAQYPQTKIT